METRTLVFRLSMDSGTEKVVYEFAREVARWEQRVFGRWYADFKAHRSDLTRAAYYGLLSSKRISAKALGKSGGRSKFRVNVKGRAPNLYSLFLTKGRRVEPAVLSTARPQALFGSLTRLGTAIENFLDHDLRRQRVHDRRVLVRRQEARAYRNGASRKPSSPKNFYPRFKPIARFKPGTAKWGGFQDGIPSPLTVSHPFESHQRLAFQVVPSDDPHFAERLRPLAELFREGKVGVEVKYHRGGELREGWYAHVAVPYTGAVPVGKVDNVMGVDVGERNPATFVVVNGPSADANRVGFPRLYHGLGARDALERQTSRARRLQSASDLGSRGARLALARAKGKQVRILHTFAHQVSHDIVARAVAQGVDALAMEDLAKFVPGLRVRRKGTPFRDTRGKRLRRLLSRWNRGQLQEAIRYKARAAGIRVAGPGGAGIYARGTSSTCPRCDGWDPSARDRAAHRFTCRRIGCGYSDNDDVTGAANIAARGYKYFHGRSEDGVVRTSRRNSGRRIIYDSPQEPDRVSTGGDSKGTSVFLEGAASTPQATMGGTVGPPSRPAENSANGVGAAVPQGNRPSPTEGVGRGIFDPTTSRSDRTRTKNASTPKGPRRPAPAQERSCLESGIPEVGPVARPMAFSHARVLENLELLPSVRPACGRNQQKRGEARVASAGIGADLRNRPQRVAIGRRMEDG